MKYLGTIWVLAIVGLFGLLLPFVASAEGFALLTGDDGPFSQVAGASDLPVFLNQVYLLCIGIAVVVSILQIIRGGITWMLTDSVVEKGQAKHLVTIAIMGLLLVLSPVIVFNIINPCILSLSLSGTEECEGSLGGLAPSPVPNPDTDPVPEEGNLLADGEYIKAIEYANTALGDLKANVFVQEKCQGFESTRIPSGDKFLLLCRKEVGFGFFFDFDGDFINDSSIDPKLANTTDRERYIAMEADCNKLRRYGLTMTGLTQDRRDEFSNGDTTFDKPTITDSCDSDGYFDLANDLNRYPLPDPSTPDKIGRVCEYVDTDPLRWCSNAAGR